MLPATAGRPTRPGAPGRGPGTRTPGADGWGTAPGAALGGSTGRRRAGTRRDGRGWARADTERLLPTRGGAGRAGHLGRGGTTPQRYRRQRGPLTVGPGRRPGAGRSCWRPGRKPSSGRLRWSARLGRAGLGRARRVGWGGREGRAMIDRRGGRLWTGDAWQRRVAAAPRGRRAGTGPGARPGSLRGRRDRRRAAVVPANDGAPRRRRGALGPAGSRSGTGRPRPQDGGRRRRRRRRPSLTERAGHRGLDGRRTGTSRTRRDMHVRTCLLATTSSFASSCTRALNALH